jgi:hypothetical protein
MWVEIIRNDGSGTLTVDAVSINTEKYRKVVLAPKIGGPKNKWFLSGKGCKRDLP